MKKIIYFVFLIPLIFPSVNSATLYHNYEGLVNDTLHHEAESAEYENLLLINDTTASGGMFLHIDNSGKIVWNLEVEKDGWYSLKIRYRAPEGEKEEYIVRNGYQFAVGFAMAANWNIFSTRTFLKQGVNTVELKKSWGNIDVDYLEIIPSIITPEITPCKNIFFKEHPRDIFIKMNRYGHKLNSITIGEKELDFSISDYPYFEDAADIRIPKENFFNLSSGNYSIKSNMDENISIESKLEIMEARKPADLTIVVPYVEHGKSVLIVLPSGKILLVDCGKDWVRDSLIIPFLYRNNIFKIDYFFITHYHGDHDSDDRGDKIKKLFNVDHFYDNRNLHTGDTLFIEGVKMNILNSFEDGRDENTSSLSFSLAYNGFVYADGGDIYAENQEKILKRFPNNVHADIYSANHHFHGSASTEYLRKMNPAIVFIQSQEAIYARSTYMVNFLEEVVKYQNTIVKNTIEGLPNIEVGLIVFRVNDKNDWSYETYHGYKNEIIIPYLVK